MQHEIAYVVKCDDLNCVMSAGGTLRQTISQAEEAWNRRAGDGK
jgi:predicted RNase H-like HicB family nuclease